MSESEEGQASGRGPAPLQGVRVLDLSRVFAGPVAGRVLADLGADVVKVEPPEGDVTRLWGRKAAGISTYFAQQNAGKRNVCIDLRRPGGPELVTDLAAEADIVIENFRPGVLTRYGLDWPALSARNPRLIMLSISGFGQTGPDAGRAAYAAVLHAEAGLIEYEGNDRPLDVSFSAADVLSGMHGVVGIMAALRVRDTTGVGQYVDLAMMDAMTFSSDRIVSSLDDHLGGEKRNGEVWETAAGPVIIPGGLRWLWHQLSNAHGLVDPTPSDGPLEDKIASRRQIISEFLRSREDRAAVFAALDAANLAWGEVREAGGVLESATIEHRESVAEIDDRAGGTRPVIRSPYRMSETEIGPPGPPSYRGEHNAEVLAEWLGGGHRPVAELEADEILLADEWASGDGPPDDGRRGEETAR